MEGSQRYTAVEVEDSEFYAPDGEPLRPHCWASLDLLTGRRQSRWTGDGPTPSPDPPGARPLRIAHQVQAEAGHRLAVGWSMGAFIDTHVELRVLANGVGLVAGDGLLGARVLFGLPPGDAAEKDAGRALAMRPEVPLADRPALQKYNQGDVALLAELAERMWPLIDIPAAIFRGQYQTVVAGMERRGIPLDVERVNLWSTHWSGIQDRLVAQIEQIAQSGIFVGGTWSHEGLNAFVMKWEAATGQRWPRSGKSRVPLTTEEVLRELTQLDPRLAPVQQMFSLRRQARGLGKLALGNDGRNRFWIDALKQKTGRDSVYGDSILGYPKYQRGLIQPRPGRAIAVLDFKNQEPAIAAALSRDNELMAICTTDDPYIALAKKFRLVPATATKKSHPLERKQCKTVLLGLNYGMQSRRLALTLRCSESHAARLIRQHKDLFGGFWRWSWLVQDTAVRQRKISTKLGFTMRITPSTKLLALLDWPMQAGGAELTRVACCFAAARGVEILASHHDSMIVESDSTTIDDVARAATQAMIDAGHELFDFPFKVDTVIVRHPDRYLPDDAGQMWDRVETIVADLLGHPRQFRGVEVPKISS